MTDSASEICAIFGISNQTNSGLFWCHLLYLCDKDKTDKEKQVRTFMSKSFDTTGWKFTLHDIRETSIYSIDLSTNELRSSSLIFLS